MSDITALIDGDIVAYRCAASCEEDDSPGLAMWRCNDLIERILERVSATGYTVYLSGGENFRKEIDSNYKANRKDKPKPKWLQACREYLVVEWNASVTDGYEADDALAAAQTDSTFICSLDKDLLQVPGMHYNWVKDEEYYITPHQGLYNFWTQTLVGDVADNITGIRGLGPKKTAKLFDPIMEENLSYEELNRRFYELVAEQYNDTERLHRNCHLLYIRRAEDDIWVNPLEKKNGPKDESEPSSLVSSEQVVDAGLPSMKPSKRRTRKPKSTKQQED